jgi:hypothetical protein
MVLHVLSSAMAGTAIPLTGAVATRKIFVLASVAECQAGVGYQTCARIEAPLFAAWY